ncbi:hypothetical protein HN375_00140 [bacterium]|nr:hypothetical protein [bacterium]
MGLKGGYPMDIRIILTVVAGFLFLFALFPYIFAIIRGETKPSKATWIIWGTIDIIVLSGMYFEDSVNGQIVGATIGAWTIVIFSIKYGTSGWTKTDKFCFGGAVLGIILWQIFNDPILGIVTSSIVALIGSVPTFVSTWKDPTKENKIAWTMFWVSCICTIFIIPKWDIANALQPIVFFTVESVMMYLLFINPRFR